MINIYSVVDSRAGGETSFMIRESDLEFIICQ